jgi:hypothetical protein
MKALFLMPVIVAAVLLAAYSALAIFGVRISPIDPTTAGAIGIAAGTIGLLPILAGGRKDPVGAFQLAFAGTVLHLLSAVALAAAAVAILLVAIQIPFMCWLMAAYWVSLITLVWQLRRLLLTTAGIGRNGTIA